MNKKRFKIVPEMEGSMARWYARTRGSDGNIAIFPRQASELTEGLATCAEILGIAPGPGYLAIEMGRLRRFHVTGLDISRTFVDIATQNAMDAGVSVDFRHGDAASPPFADESFDLVVCQAAFKNFEEPSAVLDQIHRVLKKGGTAVIQDLSREASKEDIAEEVRRQALKGVSAFFTRWVLSTMLLRRAYAPSQLERLAADSAFGTCDIRKDGIGVEVRLKKSIVAAA